MLDVLTNQLFSNRINTWLVHSLSPLAISCEYGYTTTKQLIIKPSAWIKKSPDPFVSGLSHYISRYLISLCVIIDTVNGSSVRAVTFFIDVRMKRII